MYLIDREKNRINKLEKKKFSELEFTERHHLQEWIANDPTSLGEDLLIIQKEFSGFSETNERLDLLAIDKFGNLVIIENKLDDSGKDVTWQIIKYCSYCSSLSKQEIIKIYQEFLGKKEIAEEKISEFFDNKDIEEINLNQGLTSQRLILVAANFRKEVTSSILWLMNFNMRIQCFEVTPFCLQDQLLLTFEQILPIKSNENYAISMATKAQDEIKVQETTKNRHHVRIEFWEQFISENYKRNGIFKDNSPAKENWICKGIGLSGVNLNVVVSGKYCRCEITFNTGDKDNNKKLFDFLFESKDKIEENFGHKLEWDRMDENVTSRIKYQKDDLSYFEKDDWAEINEFLIVNSIKMEKAFAEKMKSLNKFSKQNK
jgi:hypothetical protein